MIDWGNPHCKISNYFSVGEAIYLPSWNRLANINDGLNDDAKNSLLFMFQKMDQIRELLNVPIIVHVAFRSVAYNCLVKGALNSSHIARATNIAAVDFHPLLEADNQVEKCNLGRAIIMPDLEYLGLRMENGDNNPWIHLDCHPLPNGGSRFFKP